MVAALTPAHLDAGPLHEALGRLTDRIGAELGIAVRFEVCGPARPLPANAEVVLLRAAQEALANVRKHAHASDVRVILSYEPHAVRLDVRDDGAGFDPERGSAAASRPLGRRPGSAAASCPLGRRAGHV
jgi:signal transduction histidine kinase